MKPNICLPPDLRGEPLAKDKERALLFVWVSCSAVVPSRLVMIGFVGCFSPSQSIDWIWLMDWLAQSPLGFGCWVHRLREGFNIPQSDGVRQYPNPRTSKHWVFISLALFPKCLQLGPRALRFGSCPVLKTDSFYNIHCKVIVSPQTYSPSGSTRTTKPKEIVKAPILVHSLVHRWVRCL